MGRIAQWLLGKLGGVALTATVLLGIAYSANVFLGERGLIGFLGGATHEQMTELTEDVRALSVDVGFLATNVGILATNMREIKADVREIQADVREMQADVKEIKVDVENLRNSLAPGNSSSTSSPY